MLRLARVLVSGRSLFAVALAFYLVTLSPSMNWGDGGRIQLDIVLGGSNYLFLPELSGSPLDGGPFAHLGVAPWDHPLYVLLGQGALALPFGSALWRLNLLSAIAAAATIALAWHVLVELGVPRLPAALGALALAVSHTFWFHAVTTEVLSLHSFFMLSLLALALRWSRSHRPGDLRWFALLAGLGLANHLMLGLSLVPIVGYLVLSAPPTSTTEPPAPRAAQSAFLVALFLMGLAPWWVQFLRVTRVTGIGLAVAGVTWLPSASPATGAREFLQAAQNLLSYLGYLTYQFTPLGVALGVLGFARLARTQRLVAVLLGMLWATHLAFSVGFQVIDRYAFHLPSYVIFALFIGVGAQTALEEGATISATLRTRRVLRIAGLVLAVVAAPVVLYAETPRILHAWGVTDRDLAIPDVGFGARDGLTYFLNPDKRGDWSAVRFGRSTLDQLAPGAVVLAPEPFLEVGMVLRYLQRAEGARPDVYVDPIVFAPRAQLAAVTLAKARALTACRPVYLAALPGSAGDRAAVRADYRVTAEANLLRLTLRPAVVAGSCPALGEPMSLRDAVRSALQ